MARKTGSRTRALKKRKVKISKRTQAAVTGKSSTGTKKIKRSALAKKGTASAEKQKSQLLKKHAQERMVLKQHIRKLQERRVQTRKGEDAKTERREMGKYIRKLQAEQVDKHKKELESANKKVLEAQASSPQGVAAFNFKATQQDLDEDSPMAEKDLRQLFSNLLS